MLAIGGTPERWLAMQTGNASLAGILSPPYTFVADEAGFTNLGSTAKYTPNFTQTVFNVRANGRRRRKPYSCAFSARRCARRIGFTRRRKNTVRIIAKRFKFSEKHSEAAWRYFISNNAIPKGRRSQR